MFCFFFVHGFFMLLRAHHPSSIDRIDKKVNNLIPNS